MEVAKKTNTQVANGVKGLSTFLNSDSIKSKFNEILGQKGMDLSLLFYQQ
jgi:hypothetical protein